MAKYLIQDIVPNDKKRASLARKEATHHEALKPAPKPRTRAAAPKEAVQEEPHVDAVEMYTPTTPDITPHQKDPRQMLSDRMDEKPAYPAEEEKEAAHFDAPIRSVQAPEVKTPTGAWSYNSGVTDPMYASSDKTTHWGVTETGSDRSFWKAWMPWVIGAAIAGIIGVLAFNFFSSATVTILPKRDSIPMDQQMTALKSPESGELSYAVMKVTLEETREIPATGEKAVTQKASGTIIVYNTQTVTQRLIKNTRFQTPEGKIYRINDSINIPKATTAGGKTTPGSLEVTVFADEAGPDYNGVPTDFTLPGLKGSATFDKVYARSKGPIAGGASGTIKSVSDQDLKQASADLRVTLEEKLRGKAKADLAPSQIGYDGGVIVEMKDAVLSSAAASSADKAVVTEEGTLYMVTFDRKALAFAIAKSLIPTFAGEEVMITNLETLNFGMSAQKGNDLWGSEKLDFTLKGAPALEWVVDDAEIKKVLLGTPKASFNAMLVQFPTIDRAKATIQPVWKRAFPENADDIKVEIVESMAE